MNAQRGGRKRTKLDVAQAKRIWRKGAKQRRQMLIDDINRRLLP